MEKAFGFIESAIQTEGDVFFSKTELAPDLQQVVSESDLRGKPVQFEITTGKDGRSRAANVPGPGKASKEGAFGGLQGPIDSM